jgi:hypothetical protein
MNRGNGRGTTSVLGTILLVAVVVVVGSVVFLGGLAVLEGFGTPTADASFEFEQSDAGLIVRPTAIGTDVAVQLNGKQIETIGADEAGKPVLLPTAPGDEIAIVSSDGDRSVLLRERIDERRQVGDFIAYYRFEEGDSSQTVADASGNGNDGQLRSDGAGRNYEWTGCGLRLDGAAGQDYVDVSNISAPVDVSEFTIATSFVQRGSSGSVNQLVEHRFAGSNEEWFFETSPGPYSVDYAVEYPSEVVSADEINTGTRHVVVGTYDGSEYTLYVDGKRVASGSHNRPINMGDMHLGRDFESSSQYLDGELCELRLYYSAFDEAEVQRITTAMQP